jgi:hypothetical protein
MKLPTLPKLALPKLKLPRWNYSFHKKVNRKKVLLISGAVFMLFLVVGGLAGAFFVYKEQQKPSTYELTLDKTDQVVIRTNTDVKAVVAVKNQAQFSFSRPTELVLKAMLDDADIHTSTLIADKNTTELPTAVISIDGASVEEGTHTLKVTVGSVGENPQVFDTKELTIVVDRTTPELTTATTEKGYLSRYELKGDEDSSISAKNGLKLISNSKGPISLNLSFSEAVSEKDDVATDAGKLVFEGSPSSTVSATITANNNQFTTPFTFTDAAGNELLGELSFVYDGLAPKIDVYTDYRVDTNAVDTYFFRFTTSEPMAWVKGTMNGVTKTAVGSYKGYRIDGLPLTQEKNTISLVGQDLAGNQATAEAPITIVKLKTYSGFNFGRTSLPESVRLCTPDDEKACGYSHDTVGYLSCEEFKVVKDCLQKRCSRSGYSLGSCTY